MVKDFDTNLKTLFKASSTRPVRINHHLHNRDDPRLGLKRGYPVLTPWVDSAMPDMPLKSVLY